MTNILSAEIAGPHWWLSIHNNNINIKDPKDMKLQAFFLLKILPTYFPCEVCRSHYKDNLNKLPIFLDFSNTPIRALQWTIMLHNIVNNMLKKPMFPVELAFNTYTHNLPESSLFSSVWFILHNVAKESNRDFKIMLYGVAPKIMGSARFRATLLETLKKLNYPYNINGNMLLEWSLKLRNEHAKLMGISQINVKQSVQKFTESCSSCKLQK